MSIILHIAKRSKWEAALDAGEYAADSLETAGYIHCSTPDQIISVANFLFRGQADLVMLCINTDKAESEIRYENCEDGSELFPHVYGPVNLDAVTRVCDFQPLSDGTFVLPEKLMDKIR